MNEPNSSVFDQLCRLGICAPDATEHFRSGVRDRADINVLRCRKSGALFLDRTDHMDLSHYDAKPPTHRFGSEKRQIITTNDDTQRRFRQFANLVRGRNWLDVGSGSGGVLDVFAPLAAHYGAVEPQEVAAGFLSKLGHPVYRRLEDVPSGKYDVVTLFHVFEHLTDPLGVLKDLFQRLSSDGVLVVKVPHACDFLISFASNEAFCAHTFWSEHLFLHTRKTLSALAAAAGFDVISVQGVQRCPAANHLHWLAKGKSAGHVEWNMLVDKDLDRAYESALARLDLTDTLILEGKKVA